MKPHCSVLLFLFFCIIIGANAQSTAINNNVVSPAPQVAALLKFTETPVSYFNGTANVSVPLYEIHSGNLSFPIAINYNTGGIKVSEEAGIVGLGWNISTNAAVIDPIGNGNNFAKLDVAPYNVNYTPSQAPSGLTNLILAGEVFKTSQGVCTNFPQFQYQGPAANYDPDMRILNVNGISAKFMHPNGSALNTWICIDGQNVQLTESAGGTGIYHVVMPDGTKYVFDDYVQYSSMQQNQTYTSTTYLDSIISTTGKTIVFKYINPPSSLQPLVITRTQSWVRDNIAGGPGLNDVFNYSLLTEKFLSEIDFDNGKVLFNYTSRTDLASYALNSITVWRTGDTAPFKTINFGYSYFSYPEGNYGDYTQQLQTASGLVPSLTAMLATQSYRQQRLKLLSVQVNNDPPYSFTYDSTPMPYKTSWAQDLWGYFNGNTTQSLLPNYNYLPYAGTQIPISIITDAEGGAALFADRSGHFNFAKAGVLTSITYPTGGYTTFQYQPNTFSYNQGENNIVDTLVVANATGNGPVVQEFTVPDLGLVDPNNSLLDVNPAFINVNLFCGSTNSQKCNYATISGSGGCTGYNYSALPTDAANAGGLWAVIQVQDASGNWDTPANFVSYNPVLENVFDWQNPDVATTSCTVSALTKYLMPGHYRIIANYPNTLANGSPSGPDAYIQVSYKTWSATMPYNTGPGLRISTITDYVAGGQVALTRNITYTGGQLTTRPIFYRYLNDENHPPTVLPLCVQSGTLWGNVVASCAQFNQISCDCYNPLVIPRTVSIVYSDPVIPYSYSANGSLFGYSTVYEQRVNSNGVDQGRTVYTFNNQPDTYQFYGWNLPGTPSIANLTNGKLTEEDEQKDVGGQYQTIKSTQYNYTIGSPATYWGFKNEYRPNYVNCSSVTFGEPYSYTVQSTVTGSKGQDSTVAILVPGGPAPIVMSGGIGAQDNSLGGGAQLDGFQFLHFYPIPTGHVNVSSKIETSYDAATPHIVTTNYTYNTINQQSTANTVESDTKTYATQTYYPADYTSADTADFTNKMMGLHMLDYPIENISTVNGLAVSANYTSYSKHNNIITPLSTYTLNSVVPLAITQSIPANVMSTYYEPRLNFVYNSQGNLIQQQKVNGPLYNYIWDYSSDLPTAAIINATANDFAYTSFESTSTGNWSYAGTPVLDGTTPFGKYSYSLSSGAVSASNLIAANTYNLSYWTNNTSPYTIAGTAGGYPIQVRSYNGWTNYLHQVSGVTGVSISGSGSIDDIHLYPANGQMSTYIYDPLIGMTVSTDTKGNTNYYDYDQDERLMDVRDLNGNIVKAYAYNFAGWPNGTPLGNYANLAESGTFTKSCGPGYTGSGPITYTVPASTYFSNISQADANGKAIGDVTANGQNYANTNSGCVLAPCVQPTVNPVQTTAGGPVTITTNVVSAGPTYQILTVSSGGSQVGQPIVITSLTTSLALGTAPLNLAAGNTYTFTLTTSGPACNLASTPASITLH